MYFIEEIEKNGKVKAMKKHQDSFTGQFSKTVKK